MPEGEPAPYVFKDFPHSSHRVLLAWVPERPCRILDVGASEGYLGRALADRGHFVVGLERDPAAAGRAARHYAAFHQGDLESLASLPEAPFDCIVAADVLEHLIDPAAALAKLARWRAPGGSLLLSVPNVAFLLVRLGLLTGRFTYRPRGILDVTHLRFFTRRTLGEMVRGAGLGVRRHAAVPPPLPLLSGRFGRWPLRALLEGGALAARTWPGLFAYQLLVEVA
jgi:2-polyprenyl-3-methyl-5-hydroxy-6-metoxy-1,4-benzoquinol methylase